MKKSLPTAHGNKADETLIGKLLWKTFPNDILVRALPESPQDLRKILKVGDTGIRDIEEAKSLPQNLASKLTELFQNDPGLQRRLLNFANISIQNSVKNKAGLKPWEQALWLCTIAGELDFTHPWLQSEAALKNLIESADVEYQEQFSSAARFLTLAKNIRNFNENLKDHFFQSLNSQLSAIGKKIDNWEDFHKLRKELHGITSLKRDFLKDARSLRKDLLFSGAESGLDNCSPDLLSGDIWSFIGKLNLDEDTLVQCLKQAATASLPILPDINAISRLLSSIVPVVPAYDMELMQEELLDVSEFRVRQKDSQLLVNILPALKKEKNFDLESFLDADDRDQAKPFSHRFIRRLTKGLYSLSEELGNPVLEVEKAKDHETDLAEETEKDQPEENSQTGSLENRDVDDTPDENESLSSMPSRDEGEEMDASNAEAAPRHLSEAMEDGFDLLEDSLSLPPQPDTAGSALIPQSMSIEEACAISASNNPEIKPQNEAGEASDIRKIPDYAKILAGSDVERETLKAIVSFIANELDGRLDRKNLERDASIMLEMLEPQIIPDLAGLLHWIEKMQAAHVLVDDKKHIVLDPQARDDILESSDGRIE